MNPIDDLIIFVFWPLVGFIIASVVEVDIANLFWISTLFMIAIDFSHLPLTFLPHQTRWKQSIFSPLFTVYFFCVVYGFSLFFWNFDKLLFHYIVAFLVTQHQARQLYGWLVISQNKNGENNISFLDKVFFYNITLLPYLLSFSENSIHKDPKIFVSGDMNFLSFPKNAADTLFYVWLFIIAVYLILETKRTMNSKVIPINKYLIFSSAFFVFSFCYLWIPLTLYWLPHTMHHGYSYIRYNFAEYTRLNNINLGLKISLFFGLFIILLGFTFYSMGHLFSIKNNIMSALYWPLVWSVAIFHYASDAIIWRKSWRPK